MVNEGHVNAVNSTWVSQSHCLYFERFICDGSSPQNFAHISSKYVVFPRDEVYFPAALSSSYIYSSAPHVWQSVLYEATNIHPNFPTLFWATSNLNMDVFWNVTPCNLLDISRRFREVQCFHHHCSTSWNTAIFHTRRRENLKSPNVQGLHMSISKSACLVHFL